MFCCASIFLDGIIFRGGVKQETSGRCVHKLVDGNGNTLCTPHCEEHGNSGGRDVVNDVVHYEEHVNISRHYGRDIVNDACINASISSDQRSLNFMKNLFDISFTKYLESNLS